MAAVSCKRIARRPASCISCTSIDATNTQGTISDSLPATSIIVWKSTRVGVVPILSASFEKPASTSSSRVPGTVPARASAVLRTAAERRAFAPCARGEARSSIIARLAARLPLRRDRAPPLRAGGSRSSSHSHVGTRPCRGNCAACASAVFSTPIARRYTMSAKRKNGRVTETEEHAPSTELALPTITRSQSTQILKHGRRNSITKRARRNRPGSRDSKASMAAPIVSTHPSSPTCKNCKCASPASPHVSSGMVTRKNRR